jgi:hypothetical protein
MGAAAGGATMSDAGADAGGQGSDVSEPLLPPSDFDFDPSHFYIEAGLIPEARIRAVASIEEQSRYAMQIPYEATLYRAIYQHRLIYLDMDDHLRAFEPDYIGDADPNEQTPLIDAVSNDPLVPTPACPDGTFYQVIVSPDDRLYYPCEDGWYVGRTKFYDGDGIALMAINARGLILGAESIYNLVTTPGGKEYRIEDLRPDYLWGYKASRNGFYLIYETPTTNHNRKLYEVDALGKLTLIGDYPSLPPDTFVAAQPLLDADGVMYQSARDETTFTDIILKFTIGLPVETIFVLDKTPFLNSIDVYTGP